MMPEESPSPVVLATIEALHQIRNDCPGQSILLITAGATCEDIDDVRYLTNRSTGSIGLALAREARRRGIPHLLLLGAGAHQSEEHGPTVRFRSADDLHAALHAALGDCHALIMSAAVADYTPCRKEPGKRKKDGDEWVLRLKRTPDILQSLAQHPNSEGRFVVGFALEATLDEAEGQRKLKAKNLDALLLNTTAAFGPGMSEAVLLFPDGEARPLGTVSKDELASSLLDLLPAGF